MNRDLNILADAIYAVGFRQFEQLTYNRTRAANMAGVIASVLVEGIATNPEAALALDRLIQERRDNLQSCA